ncbi:hypothetical protein [Streptomyces sp. NPDC004135]
MSHAAGEWWESGSWWQFVITIVAGVAVGILGAWAAFRSSNPKRKLNWWVQSNTPLLTSARFAHPAAPADEPLRVHYYTRLLTSPRIVELVIANQGRRDITAAMFHASEPIRFDFDCEVLAILDLVSTPSGTILPSFQMTPVVITGVASHGDSWLDLPPALLARGQVITVTVLVDGDQKPVKCQRFPLVDVIQASESPGARSRTLAQAVGRGVTSVLPFR